MIEATRLKNGKTFLINENPYRVVKYTHQKIGRGGATVILSVRNLVNGALKEIKLNSSAKVEEISTRKKTLQFLYSDTDMAIFIDPKSYEQLEIPLEVIKEDLQYVKEGQNINVLYWGTRPLSIELPPKVVLEVTVTSPGVKGNTATNTYKPAVLENGLGIRVPLFIRKGDMVRVDTRTGEYVERIRD
jgi:elongation factor P